MKFINYLLLTAVMCACTYACFAFVSWIPDPANWTPDGRLCYVALSFVLSFAAIGVYENW